MKRSPVTAAAGSPAGAENIPQAGPLVAAAAGCELAENPLWHADERALYWTDIPAGKLYRWDSRSGRHQVIYRGPPVGGFTLQADGSLLLFRVDDFACLHPDGRMGALWKFSREGTERFNDVIADPAGRVFAGTIGRHPDCGLFRIDVDGKVTQLFAGTGCSNGMGFSADLKQFYWTCSTTRRIFQFDYEAASGALSNQKVFYEAAGGEGIPDGLTVDLEGWIWSARWGAAGVLRHRPDGTVAERINLPATNITSICFGGEKFDELFITSAREPGKHEALAGAVFRIRVGARGRAEFKSAIGLEGNLKS